MPSDDKMTIGETRKYMAIMQRRYRVADKEGRAALLDEMEAFTGQHRKSLTRLMNSPDLSRKPRAQQRGRVYGPEVDDAIRVIA